MTAHHFDATSTRISANSSRAVQLVRFTRASHDRQVGSADNVSVKQNGTQADEIRVEGMNLDSQYKKYFWDSSPQQVFQSVPLSAVYTPTMSTGGYMKRQVDQFMGQLSDLLARYEGRYVAFEDGQVLATGDTIRQVLNQVNTRRGEVRPILVRRVQREYPPIEM